MTEVESTKQLFKELVAINRKSVFDDLAVISTVNDSPFHLKILLTPNSGPYTGGAFKFTMNLPKNYPNSAPKIKCNQKIYHPNIYNGNICFSMLTEHWSNTYRIEHYVNGLLYLLQYPNLDSRLNSSVEHNGFEENVRKSLLGAVIGGVTYPNCTVVRDTSPSELILESFKLKLPFDSIHFRSGTVTELKLQDLLPEQRNELAERLPWISRFEETSVPFSLIFVGSSRLHTVKIRANKLKVPEQQVLKELVFRSENGKPVLVLSNGEDLINPTVLATELGMGVTKPKRTEIPSLINMGPDSIQVFSEVFSTVFINTRIMNLDEPIYFAGGYSKILFKLSGRDMAKLFPTAKFVDVTTPFTPESVETITNLTNELTIEPVTAVTVATPTEVPTTSSTFIFGPSLRSSRGFMRSSSFDTGARQGRVFARSLSLDNSQTETEAHEISIPPARTSSAAMVFPPRQQTEIQPARQINTELVTVS